LDLAQIEFKIFYSKSITPIHNLFDTSHTTSGDGGGKPHLPVQPTPAEEALQAGGQGAFPLLQRAHTGDCRRLAQRVHSLLERNLNETGSAR